MENVGLYERNGSAIPLTAVELGGEVVQVLGTQLSEERATGVRIRAGDSVRIEEVDSKRNRCKVSRIGLAEAESPGADRY